MRGSWTAAHVAATASGGGGDWWAGAGARGRLGGGRAGRPHPAGGHRRRGSGGCGGRPPTAHRLRGAVAPRGSVAATPAARLAAAPAVAAAVVGAAGRRGGGRGTAAGLLGVTPAWPRPVHPCAPRRPAPCRRRRHRARRSAPSRPRAGCPCGGGHWRRASLPPDRVEGAVHRADAGRAGRRGCGDVRVAGGGRPACVAARGGAVAGWGGGSRWPTPRPTVSKRPPPARRGPRGAAPAPRLPAGGAAGRGTKSARRALAGRRGGRHGVHAPARPHGGARRVETGYDHAGRRLVARRPQCRPPRSPVNPTGSRHGRGGPDARRRRLLFSPPRGDPPADASVAVASADATPASIRAWGDLLPRAASRDDWCPLRVLPVIPFPPLRPPVPQPKEPLQQPGLDSASPPSVSDPVLAHACSPLPSPSPPGP